MNLSKHKGDDGRELFEKHGDKRVPFNEQQRYNHFDYLENQKVYEDTRILELRSSAYKSESDPLYMEWQFDQTAESEQAWRNKVAEIKLRYPLADPT